MDALESKKGEHIVLLDIHEIASFADYFVIATGTSDRMLDALSESVMDAVPKKRTQKQGLARDGWVVVDYGDVVVHLFSADQRKFYDLEGLWHDGKVLLRVV